MGPFVYYKIHYQYKSKKNQRIYIPKNIPYTRLVLGSLNEELAYLIIMW